MPTPDFINTTDVNNDIDITNTQYQAQELSGLEASIRNSPFLNREDNVVVVDSFPSVPAFRVNVPEISKIKTKFIYNYFTANEREVINNPRSVLDVSVSRDEEIFFQLNNDKKPRYVTISFKPPVKFSSIGELRNSKIVTQNIDKILVEGGVSNSDYASFEIVDSLKEKHLYSLLDASMFFTEVEDPKNSPQDNYKKLLEAQEDGTLTGKEKKFLASALQGLQSKGFRMSRTDITEDVAQTADDLVSRQNFSIQANKLVFDQIVESAIRIPDSVFQDEFKLAKSYALKSRESSIKRNYANSTSESVYSTATSTISSQPVASIFGKTKDASKFKEFLNSFPIIKHAGYLINKLEVLQDGTYEPKGQLVTDNPDGLYIIDENVRYGGIYVYEIKSIYYVKMIAEERNENTSLDDLSVVEILIASEGKLSSVHCIEHLPPPPPSSIRITFEQKTKKPRLSWQFPVNPQRDIKRFQIFKRQNINLPFTLIAEYDFDNSTIKSSVAEIASRDQLYTLPYPKISFIDNTWKDGETPIYTVACVDAHGLSSNYGTQIKFSYDKRLNKVKNTIISNPNAPKPYPNIFINKDSFEDAIKVSGYERMRVYLDPEYYKVTKYIDKDPNKESDLNFLRIDPAQDTYKIHMINLDNHKDKILNIRIADFSGDPLKTTIQTKK